ncbi:chitinase, partial [Streptomyces sp. SID13726]|nr:chitinase [Streptomyces sp. SID13726]
NPTSTAMTQWTLEFDLPPGVTMGGFYHGTATQTGNHVKVVNAHYNGSIPAGGSTTTWSPWFIAYGSGAAPLNCRINGFKCDGSADQPPSAPTGLTATGRTTTTASLSWTAATAADFPVAGYEVLVDGTVETSVTSTEVVLTGRSPSTPYTVTVRATDTRGNASAPSAPVTVTTLDPADDTTPPTTPGGLRATARSSTTVSLAWDPSSDANGIAGYDVYVDGTRRSTVTGTTATVPGL